MAGVLRADPLWVETFTGLRMRQCEGLLRVVRERGGNGPGGGRPWCLPLADRVLLVAVYYRTNLTMRQLAPLFAVSPATVCRVIQRLRPLLALESISRPADTTDRLDGGRHLERSPCGGLAPPTSTSDQSVWLHLVGAKAWWWRPRTSDAATLWIGVEAGPSKGMRLTHVDRHHHPHQTAHRCTCIAEGYYLVPDGAVAAKP